AAGSVGQHSGSKRIEVQRPSNLVRGVLRLAECEHGHRLHQALRLRGNVELLCVQRLDPFAAGRPAGPGKKARRWRKQLQLDLAPPETRPSAWKGLPVVVWRS